MVKLITTATEEDDGSETLARQVSGFFVHCFLAVLAWIAMMLVGYAIKPEYVPQPIVLALSLLVPLVAGAFVTRAHTSEMAPHIWLGGIIWMLFLSLWIIDLPTGPNACNECSATDKIMSSLFSYPSPSGLMDDNAPFFITWPAAAMIGYAIGARIVQPRKKRAAKPEPEAE
ncbi:MAG TPA: hypothetical protein VF742_17400 [Terracidiphilus sp.]